MIARTYPDVQFQDQFDDFEELDQFERFTYRRGNEFPVRSNAAQTRAKMRSRGSTAARHKSSAFNGIKRRGTGKRYRMLS